MSDLERLALIHDTIKVALECAGAIIATTLLIVYLIWRRI
jgi:hypothetical protein